MKNVTRIFDIAYYQLTQFPQEVCIAGKENGKWRTYSTQEYVDKANQISRALLKMGIQPGDKIALITNNRPEWNIMDLGILQVGAIDVPVYPTITENDYKFIFNDAQVKLCFVSDIDLYTKVSNIINEVPSLTDIYTFNEVSGAKNWKEVLELGLTGDDAEIEKRKKAIAPKDLATLIYTSGTTGLPKGVMLSHENLVENAKGSRPRLPLDENACGLSFLPLCHVYERMITYLYQLTGVSLYYAESLDTIKDNIVELKPHVFTAVPRLLEKVYDGIVTKGLEGGGIKAKIFKWALDLTETYEYGSKPNFKRKIAEKLVYSKIREKLGGRIMAVASGAAALQPRLARFFHAIGIPVYEGYGLTETSPVITVNADVSGVRFGTVGTALANVQVKIAGDGEILTKGPCLMMGYFNRPDLTAEVIDSEGWFHTGDIGELSPDNFLKITDRKKEIFKTSGGKYVAPQVMENKFKESRFIEQIMVIGEGEKHPAALVVPAFAYLTEWSKGMGLHFNSHIEMISHKEVIKAIGAEIEKYNEQFGSWEQVKKFELLDSEMSIESGELTPTLKLKRKIIMERRKDQVAKIYGNS